MYRIRMEQAVLGRDLAPAKRSWLAYKMRRIVAEPDWNRQLELWNEVKQ